MPSPSPPALLTPAVPPVAPISDGPEFLKWLGLMFYATSVLMTNAALLIMKRSTVTERDLPLSKRRTFIFGWLLNFVSEVAFSNVALALAPLAMLAPIAGIGIPAAAVFARTGWFGPKEYLMPIECMGGLVTIAGVVIASVVGPSGAVPNLRTLGGVFGEVTTLSFLVPQLGITAAWICLMKRESLAKYRPPEVSTVKAFMSAYTSGFLIGLSYMFFKIFTLAIKGLFRGDTGVLAVPLLWVSVVLIGPNVVAQGDFFPRSRSFRL